MRKILVLFAHPAQGRSEVNIELARAADELDGVTLVDLYAEYPDYFINADREQQRLLDHDVIIFLYPFYWYSTPAILKEWQDIVLEYGFAYGKGGNCLKGKLFFSALSAGGSREAYMETGKNHFTLRELLQPLEQTAALCQMVYLPPFALFSSRRAYEEKRVRGHAERWLELLERLKDEHFDPEGVRHLEVLNDAPILSEETERM